MTEKLNITWTKNKIVLTILCCLGLLGFISIQFSYVRLIVISLTENFILHRQLEDPAKWHNKMLFWSIRGIVVFVIIFFILIFIKQLKHIFESIIIKIKRISSFNNAVIYITTINYRQFIKPTLIMFGIYTLGISALIRADFSYEDDLARSRDGDRGWGYWSRHISDFLAIFFHADIRISDITPLTQLIAAFFIAVSSVLLVYIINEKKITKLALTASIPVGLSPYFLGCFSYKFDSPYMALSVLVSIIPFVFSNNKLVFSVSSIIGLLIMCMTYQASSGIYIIIVIFLCFYQWTTRQKTNQEIITFLSISIFSYCIAMLLFKIFFMIPRDDYASTSFYSISQIISGFINNMLIYVEYVRYDFSTIWKILLLLLVFSFCIKNVIYTRQRKLFAFIVGFIVIIFMSIFSYGVYLLLTNPIYTPRAMFGFGIFIAIISIFTVGTPKKLYALPALALSWCFFIFSFSYGNALAAQKQYMEFRTEMLIHDLAILFPERNGNNYPMKIIGHTQKQPVVSHTASRNPIINRLIHNSLRQSGTWRGYLLMYHYNINLDLTSEDIEEEKYEQIFDSAYHTIKSDGELVIIILK